MRQTGGAALGEISTRSSDRSRAILRASKGGMMPSCSPFSSMTRISRARIRSLVRMKDFAERLSIGGIGYLHSVPAGRHVSKGLDCKPRLKVAYRQKYSIMRVCGLISRRRVVGQFEVRGKRSFRKRRI